MTDDTKRAEELALEVLSSWGKHYPSTPTLARALLASLERERRAADEALERAAKACELVWRAGDWSDGVMVAQQCAKAVRALQLNAAGRGNAAPSGADSTEPAAPDAARPEGR